MLGNLTGSASPLQQLVRPNQQQDQGTDPGANIPGVRGGRPPQLGNPQGNGNRNFPQQYDRAGFEETNDDDDVDLELESYLPQDDNGSDKSKTKPVEDPNDDELPTPQQAQFETISKSLAGNVRIDPELAQRALSGDAEAFNQLLGGALQQTIQHTLHAATVTSMKFGDAARQKQSQKIQSELQRQSASDSVYSAAVRLNPSLANGTQAAMLKVAVADLQQQYPGAPPELLAKKAAKMFGSLPRQKSNNPAGEVNWLEELGQ